MKFFALMCALVLAGCGQANAQTAQSGAPSDCSGTVGTSSQAVVFPSSGNTGPAQPHYYIIINNPSTTATLAINFNGAAAVVNAAGSITLNPTGVANNTIIFSAAMGLPVPAQVSIIASALSSPFTCKYQ